MKLIFMGFDLLIQFDLLLCFRHFCREWHWLAGLISKILRITVTFRNTNFLFKIPIDFDDGFSESCENPDTSTVPEQPLSTDPKVGRHHIKTSPKKGASIRM